MDFSSAVAEATLTRLRRRFGAQADAWWGRLPAVVEQLAGRWQLVMGDPVGRGNTSLVVRCQVLGRGPAILKLIPDQALAAIEAVVLRGWEPTGCVPPLWGHDKAAGALLLEAIPNEIPLWESRTQVNLADVAGLIGALHQSGAAVAADGVVSLADRVEFIYGFWADRYSHTPEVTRVVSAARLSRAHELARALATPDQVPPVLLHGDLHPGNVLDGGTGRGLIAIDPRPCVGDPAFDVVDWVFWLTSEPGTWNVRARELAAALHLDPQRIMDWCAAFAAPLAAGKIVRGAPADHITSLLSLAP